MINTKENLYDIVGNLTSNVELPQLYIGRDASNVYKTKAIKYFENMNIGDSFTVKSRSVEGVKRWTKDWRRDLRVTGNKDSIKLANRGFVTKYEEVENTKGCRVWRFK
tara:strand:+ start:542 stop:865 length:324 start_codon:yes stop_codon:yes gene_type:complete